MYYHSKLSILKEFDVFSPNVKYRLHYPPRELKELEDLEDILTLHSLLWIPEGKGITLEPHGGHGNHSTVPGIGGKTNLFLVSRMFWCEVVSKSPICWGTSNPQFGFKQVRHCFSKCMLLL
jgi:hypothetical protein